MTVSGDHQDEPTSMSILHVKGEKYLFSLYSFIERVIEFSTIHVKNQQIYLFYDRF